MKNYELSIKYLIRWLYSAVEDTVSYGNLIKERYDLKNARWITLHRPDCNIETAYAFLLYWKYSGKSRYKDAARVLYENVVKMQNSDGSFPFSDGSDKNKYFNDNSEVAIFLMRMALADTEYSEKYIRTALACTDWLIQHQRSDGSYTDFYGNTVGLPMFTAHVIAALSMAYQYADNKNEYIRVIENGIAFIGSNIGNDGRIKCCYEINRGIEYWRPPSSDQAITIRGVAMAEYYLKNNTNISTWREYRHNMLSYLDSLIDESGAVKNGLGDNINGADIPGLTDHVYTTAFAIEAYTWSYLLDYCSKICIIGDSISTYAGYIPNEYATYYPQGKINDVSKTYWYIVCNRLNAVFQNLSYSGSTVTNQEAPSADFYQRALLVNEDINHIIVALGVNDTTKEDNVGELDYNKNINEYDESIFTEAYLKGVKTLMASHPNAKITLVVMALPNQMPNRANVIEAIANNYGLGFIDMRGTYTGQLHPDTDATDNGDEMKDIAHKLYNYIISNIGGNCEALCNFVNNNLCFTTPEQETQDLSKYSDTNTNGVIRGAYNIIENNWDTSSLIHNPGNEGGANMVYTGWTNAPLVAKLLFYNEEPYIDDDVLLVKAPIKLFYNGNLYSYILSEESPLKLFYGGDTLSIKITEKGNSPFKLFYNGSIYSIDVIKEED